MSGRRGLFGAMNYSTPGSVRDLLGASAGGDPYAQYPMAQNPDTSTWDRRADGSDKGMGWLGLRQRPDGGVSSEISVDVGHGDIPSMVPGLTPSEMNFLMTTPVDRMAGHWMPSILQKAQAWAQMRQASGLSPFRQPNEAIAPVDPAPAGVWPINYRLPNGR